MSAYTKTPLSTAWYQWTPLGRCLTFFLAAASIWCLLANYHIFPNEPTAPPGEIYETNPPMAQLWSARKRVCGHLTHDSGCQFRRW